MSKYLSRACELRASLIPHYNCAQSVLVPFAEEAGYTTEQACAYAAAFGGGMQTGDLCGAFTGGLMALGVLGKADRKRVQELQRRMRENHGGDLLCVDLLRKNKEAGGKKKPHCDAMVYEAISLVEELAGLEA